MLPALLTGCETLPVTILQAAPVVVVEKLTVEEVIILVLVLRPFSLPIVEVRVLAEVSSPNVRLVAVPVIVAGELAVIEVEIVVSV